jgi:hypothetical protein
MESFKTNSRLHRMHKAMLKYEILLKYLNLSCRFH